MENVSLEIRTVKVPYVTLPKGEKFRLSDINKLLSKVRSGHDSDYLLSKKDPKSGYNYSCQMALLECDVFKEATYYLERSKVLFKGENYDSFSEIIERFNKSLDFEIIF